VDENVGAFDKLSPPQLHKEHLPHSTTESMPGSEFCFRTATSKL